MLEKGRRDQWSVDELDWRLAPPRMPPDKEEAVVQYFTDMAGIERLAGAEQLAGEISGQHPRCVAAGSVQHQHRLARGLADGGVMQPQFRHGFAGVEL